MAASKTVTQLISACPATFTNTEDVSEWLAECYRWAEIEDHPEVKETTWIGLAKIDNLDARRQYKETCLSQLKAIKDITVVNSQQEVNP